MSSEKLLKDKRLYVIFSITLVGVMGVASITPALPKMAQTLALSKSQIGLLISAFTFPGIFVAPIAGILADRWGRKTVLVPSLIIFSIAGTAIFFTHQWHYIVLFRIIQGIGAAPLGSLNATLIADFFKGKQRPEAMGYNASVLSLSTATYPLIGGALAGIGWYYPFLLPILALPIGVLVLAIMPEPTIERPTDFKQYLKAISTSILRKEVIAIFLLSIITFIILYGALLTYMPFLLHDKFQLDSPQIGLVFFISSITTAIIATQVGKLTAKYGSITLLKVAFLLYFLVTLVLPQIANLYIFLIPILIFGTAQALNMPSLQTVLANLSPDNQRGAFMSLNGMVLRLGQTLGPLVIGIGYKYNGLNGAYMTAAVTALLGGVVLFWLFPHKLK